MKKMIERCWLPVLLCLGLLLVGCDTEDEHLANFAERSSQRQADQNQEMARLNRDVAKAIQSVSTDQTESRKEYTELLGQIQNQHEHVAAETTKLADERKRIELQRRRDSVLAPIFTTFGSVLICLLPLFVVWKLLAKVSVESSPDDGLVELLTNELVAEKPIFLPPQRHDPPSETQRINEDENREAVDE